MSREGPSIQPTAPLPEAGIENFRELARRIGQRELDALPPARILRDPESGILVSGSRGAAAGAGRGRCWRGPWQVLALVNGEGGELCQVALTPERARELAAELVDMADVLEGKVW
jgi:hypothetical protein